MGVLSDCILQMLAMEFKTNERFSLTEVPLQGIKIDFMRAQWVVDHNVTLKNCGLITNRGYIAMVSSDYVLDLNHTSCTVFAPTANSSSSLASGSPSLII
ncbi:hypothetical protein H4S07_002696 [Coemansia furcata]|uniref:Uncharacterized protein n=1 Tax=Coemansia furcata TaxID=417177 RepID=A0ACC1LJT9_9FUNG|nr:hypothetical protein H4S07_002696 [Coemansia furcata]